MPQPIFLSAMLRKAEQLPSFQCWMGAKVSKLLRRDDGAGVGVSGGQHGGATFEVRADVVVGADGRYSMIAKLGGFTDAYHHHDFDIIWFTIPQPKDWVGTLYVSLGKTVRGLVLPKDQHNLQAGMALPTGGGREWRKQGVGYVAEKVRQF